MEKKSKVSLISIISQIIVIGMLVVVIVLLFKNNNNKSMENTTPDKSANEILLNQNLMAMKDAAREYFTVNKMPKDDEEIILTLGEMYRKEKVVTLYDSNMNECDDDKSYVKVRKVNDEYEINVSLTCGDVTKKIVSNVGCYDFCNGNNCVKPDVKPEKKPEPTTSCNTITKTKYEYSKRENSSKIWGPFSEWTKTTHYASNTKKVETKNVTEYCGEKEVKTPAYENVTYTCPKEYNISKDQKTCTREIITTDKIEANRNVSYTCPDGYSISSDQKTCTKTVTDTVSRNSKKVCPSGYSLNNGTCQKKTSTSATPHVKVSFDCENGVCQTVSKIDYYLCNNQKQSSSTCVTYTYKTPSTSYSCPSGYTMSGTSCIKETIESVPSTNNINFTCNTGYKLTNDNYCTKDIIKIDSVDSNKKINFTCKEGSLRDNLCITKEKTYKNVTYYRYSILNITQGSLSTKWSYSNYDTNLLNAGYRLTGNKKTENIKECSK